MTAVGTTTTPSTGAHAPVLARLRRTLGNSRLVPYYYLAPMLVLLGLFTYWPFVHTVYLSLTEWNLRPDTPLRFVGAANFAGITDNRLFQDALRNTLIYIAGSMLLLLAVLVFSVSRSYALSLAVVVIAGLGNAGFNTMQMSLTMLRPRDEMRGAALGAGDRGELSPGSTSLPGP